MVCFNTIVIERENGMKVSPRNFSTEKLIPGKRIVLCEIKKNENFRALRY